MNSGSADATAARLLAANAQTGDERADRSDETPSFQKKTNLYGIRSHI
jgi:hypothetical protein